MEVEETHENSSVVLGRKLAVAICYGFFSIVMVFLNRILFKTFEFDFPLFIVMLQSGLTLILLEVMRITKAHPIQMFTPERGWTVLPISVCFCLQSTFAMSSLAGMNIPMYGTIKRFVPLVSLVLGYFLLGGKGRPSRGVVISIVIITVGAVWASFTDLTFDVIAYRNAFCSVLGHALQLVLVEKLAPNFAMPDLLYVNCFNSIFILILMDVLDDEVRDVIIFFTTKGSPQMWANLLATLLCGILLQYFSFACTALNSALTTTVVGNGKAILQTLLGLLTSVVWFTDIKLSVSHLLGFVVNIIGCCLYSYVKYREKRRES